MFPGITVNLGSTKALSVADAPIVLVATMISATWATVTFAEPIYKGDAPITSYTAISIPDNITASTGTTGAKIIRITGLTPGTNYSFAVVANNELGASALPAISSNVISTPAGVPLAPTNIVATFINTTQVDVNYTAPFNGGSTITSYTAISTPGNITRTLTTSGSGVISVTGLNLGTAYTFTVYATNAIGNGPNSSASNSVTVQTTVPNPPTVGTPVVISSTQINVPFTAPAGNGGSAITSYTAISNPGNRTATLNQAGSGVISITGLSTATSYTFSVYATNAIGTSSFAISSSATTNPSIPDNPTNITASATSSTRATINFTAPTFNGESAITSYTATSAPGNITGTFLGSGSGSIIVDGLTPATTYSFTVRATNSVGNSINNLTSNSITTPASVPTAPTNPVASLDSAAPSTSALITYTASSFNGGSAITSYTAISTPGNITGTTSTFGTIRVTGLSSSTNYTFQVYATNAIGNSAFSNPSSSITTAAPPSVPGSPTNIVATLQGSSVVVAVAFTAPASNGGAAITSYTATSSPGGITGTTSTFGTIQVTGLAASTVYTFTVYATNAVGNGLPSNASNSVTTPVPTSQSEYIVSGTYTWTVPSGVTRVSVLVVGPGGNGGASRGGGGGGGALAYANNIAVTPGLQYTLRVGSPGISSFFNSEFFLNAGSGGNGSNVQNVTAGGGGGAGGYAGVGGFGGPGRGTTFYSGGNAGAASGSAMTAGFSGGNGGRGSISCGAFVAGAGAGGGGGGGGGSSTSAQAGGGVGIYGQGANGVRGLCTFGSAAATIVANGGSGGRAGNSDGPGLGGSAGGGGRGGGGAGSSGAVRIIWPGTTRSFPTTGTANQ